MAARTKVDLLVTASQVVTMDRDGTVLEPGAVAIDGERLVAVGEPAALRERYEPASVLTAADHALLPGLVDTYTHAGHGLGRGLFHPEHGWPAGRLYWSATSVDWWAAEGALAALERTFCGVTTSGVIVGSTPARCDEPDDAMAVARDVATSLRARGDDRARAVLAPPYLFGRHGPSDVARYRWR